jgi:hypothetical protein
MTAFVEKFALEVAATLAVGAVTAFLYGLSSTTSEAAGRARPASGCPHCGGPSRRRAGLRHAG